MIEHNSRFSKMLRILQNTTYYHNFSLRLQRGGHQIKMYFFLSTRNGCVVTGVTLKPCVFYTMNFWRKENWQKLKHNTLFLTYNIDNVNLAERRVGQDGFIPKSNFGLRL